ncbi:MAG: hypothetical protein KC620_10300 [Myxococcales bacterium]|nr:hypothetical protein [Myxococcales bacterium]
MGSRTLLLLGVFWVIGASGCAPDEAELPPDAAQALGDAVPPGDAAEPGGGPDLGHRDAGLPADCESFTRFSADIAGPIATRCAECHRNGGAAAGTRLGLPGPQGANFVVYAFEGFRRALPRVERGPDGTSYLLLKPSAQVPHGGGVVLPPDGADFAAMMGFVEALEADLASGACEAGGPEPAPTVDLLSPDQTLRKALVQLVGRLPTEAERAELAEAGETWETALDRVLRAAMAEPAFDQRLFELFNDLLLTDVGRFEQSYGGLSGSSVPPELRALPQCDAVNWQNYDERTGTDDSRTCIAANEALAMEPVRMIAHVVREDRAFGEILTAQYRYLNVFAARLFGLDLAPFVGHEDDPDFFAEVRIPAMHGPDGLPEEYAGLVTTNAFLYRYRSSSTNRNRGRAYHFQVMFRGLDVMKAAARIDLSQVDLSADPWRHDPQCTGCHSQIDPIAGAFQHWTNCYDIADVKYYTERYCGGPWFPEEQMFAPGVGSAAADRLDDAALPTAMRHLAEATVARPDFARAIASHVFFGLTGQSPIALPVDREPPEALAQAATTQSRTIDALGELFFASDLDFKALVVAIVRSTPFRAVAAHALGDDALMAATGLGGGTWTPPEVLHRKVAAIFGAPWSAEGALAAETVSLRDPPYPLLSLHRMRILAGGIDSRNLRRRLRVPSAMALAVGERMALEMSCHYTAWDFAQPREMRRLFPTVDADTPVDDPAVVATLQALHDRFLGDRLAPDDPEIAASLALLRGVQSDLAAQIAAGTLSPTLPEPCQARRHFATGVELPQAQWRTDDPDGIVRAWQAVLVYLMSDHRFLFEL